MFLKRIDNNLINNNEKMFLSFLEGTTKYPYKSDNIRFLVIKSKITKEMIEDFFQGLLKDMLIYHIDDKFIVFYNSKERIEINNFVDMFNEDTGIKSLFFEGFLIKPTNKEKFLEFLDTLLEKFEFSSSYSKISDYIFMINGDKEKIKDIKAILLNKYLLDNEFYNLVKALFKNNLNVSKAANSLYMHRNTLINRLNNFENETTLSISNFNDAVALYELLK